MNSIPPNRIQVCIAKKYISDLICFRTEEGVVVLTPFRYMPFYLWGYKTEDPLGNGKQRVWVFLTSNFLDLLDPRTNGMMPSLRLINGSRGLGVFFTSAVNSWVHYSHS